MQMVLGVVLPIFALVLCGSLAGRFELISPSGAGSLNAYVYYFALPALLFLAVAKAPVGELANWGFLWANLGGIIVAFLISTVIARQFYREKFPKAAMWGMNASFPNSGYMGVPLLIAAFGPAAALPAALATVIHNIPVISAIIVSFEYSAAKSKGYPKDAFKARSQEAIVALMNAARALAMNPIILSVLIGTAVSLFGFDLPTVVETFAGLLANSAGPTALFALGLGLVVRQSLTTSVPTGTSYPDNARVMIPVVLKLVLQPLVAFVLAVYVFELEQLWATVAVIMSALPVGATAYVFAERYGALEEETSRAILISTVLSVISISLLLLLAPGGAQ